ncbi:MULTISPECIES: DHH family phosphoesterase [Priestia]|jgi:oligoribonuclease NrnB/cAMP/cGMP phosphodiesterase (DHH superfamily)|uniref:DHHA1 domain protein n=4 Tax=Priestia TaxID=2800373 RepID=D5E2V6_PRIM1|nr:MULTISPECIES: oligoribonuclease [Priestia]KQU22616.1 oligoribonuclease [Bacillus sp. Leaf75]MBZ5481179.1 oligoribonuclease [Bacillus sp. T_4]MCJ7985123.1 oligoribonuclease [Priestia sp. OVL9]MDH6653251.1 oligoribonuclease NrnB/cAMP/cGMP phosphodiesterase (DHH superfamily) [Bacillus sp. PvP124]MDP9576648.1 oligoribonuclease NrnB/cAMP/cGMP phosphodiesterase (DHH superfamily) [Bacillus sp. 1751]
MYKLLSHTDLDGVGCGVLAKLAFGDRIKIRYNSIASLNREVEWFLENEERNTHLFITDLSVNEENEKRLEEFYQTGGKVQLLDHHKTALHFNEYEWGHVVVEDNEGNLASGTSLFYEYLIENELIQTSNAVDEFVELVRQYDTWEWEKNNNQEAHRLNALFFLISIDEFEEKMVNRLQNSDHFFFDEFEQKILDMEEDKVERYIRRKRRELVQTSIGDYLAGIVYAESYHSELGNELGKEYPHLDYIAMLNMGGKRISLRTIHDHVDVSEVAGHYGGGGHAKAAGCSLTNEAYNQFVTDTFHLDPVREDARRNRYNLKESSSGSLYETQNDDMFLVSLQNEDEWIIENSKGLSIHTFKSFKEAEIFLKRNYAAWLVRDDIFVKYLIRYIKKLKHEE